MPCTTVTNFCSEGKVLNKYYLNFFDFSQNPRTSGPITNEDGEHQHILCIVTTYHSTLITAKLIFFHPNLVKGL